MPLARQPTQRTTLPLLEPMQRTALPNKGVGHSRTKRAAGPRLGGPFLLAGHTGYLATSRARRALKADTPFGAAESVLTRNRASAYRGTTRRRGIIMSCSPPSAADPAKIGRASCRERGCQY